MGTPSAPLPPLPHGSVSDRESHAAPAAAKFVNSQSVMAMSSLMPSASMQSMTQGAENSGGAGRKIAHNRSVSEPDFGRTSKQVLTREALRGISFSLLILSFLFSSLHFIFKILTGCRIRWHAEWCIRVGQFSVWLVGLHTAEDYGICVENPPSGICWLLWDWSISTSLFGLFLSMQC